MERLAKKGALISLAIILATSLMIPLGGGTSLKSAWADSSTSTSTSTTNNDISLTIKAGAAVLKKGTTNVYTFPHLTVESNSQRPIKSITVQFTSPITGGDAITLPGAGKFERYSGSKRGNVSINVPAGATTVEWQNYLRENLEITLDGTTTKSLRMIANFEPITSTIDYNALNGHYYETVKASGASWDTAYREAHNYKYMGMQGYLVTITSQKEHDYVYSMINENCWTAATCLDEYTGPVKNTYSDFYKQKGINIPNSTMPINAYYFWVDGPEKGKLVSYGLTTPHAAPDPSPDPVHVAAVTGAAKDYIYTNWSSGEPNDSSGEQCMHLYKDTAGRWNDFSRTNGKCTAYVIEYGGMEGDDDSGVGNTGGDGNTNVDVFVKVDINVDPEGKTITTEADNVYVGQPLSVRENVNGGEVETITGKVGDNFTTVPMTPNRAYYKLKAGKNVNSSNPDDWEQLSSDPTHIGTYKVVSSGVFQAPYTDEAGTDHQQIMYKEGSTTFKILPKQIDLTKPATPITDPSNPGGTDPSDPSNPDDPTNPPFDPDATKDTVVKDVDPNNPSGDPVDVPVSGRHYTKTYDGTVNLAGGTINISDTLVPGAQAYLTYTSAEYVDKNAGTGKDLVLHGVEIHGIDAADYSIKGLTKVGEDTTLTVKGVITPRELVIDTRFPADPNTTVSTWVTGVPYVDPSDATTPKDTYFHNAQVAEVDADLATLPKNSLVPGDTIEDVLGDATYTVTSRGGLIFDIEDPQPATYSLIPHLAKVSTTGSAQGFLTENGNYYVKFNNAQLQVTARPSANLTEDENGDPDPIEITEPKKEPGTPPLTDDDIDKIIKDKFPGDKPGDNPGGDTPGGTDPSDPSNPGGDNPTIPEGVDPIITITKGKTVVPEIDPTVPGEYHIHVVYPDPDGTDVEVDIIYIVEPDPAHSDPEAVTYSINTKLKGVTAGATITPSQNVAKGADATINWAAGPDTYIALIEIDGKAIDPLAKDFTFSNIAGNHEVVVTLAEVPVIPAQITPGYYTITVNKYGATKGLTTSDSAITTKGDNHQVAWSVDPNYVVKSVSIDGKKLSDEQVKAGSYTFTNIDANHAVDIVAEAATGDLMLNQDDIQVTTQIVGGPGTITGGSTIEKGGSYHVAWQPVIQTTTDRDDPNYAVYEVESVTVNDKTAAGIDDRDLDLNSIKENKNVVVKMRPVVYDVNVLTYGNGSAVPSKTVFKGNHYVDIHADAAAGARITYVEVDGVKTYEEKPDGTIDTGAGASLEAEQQAAPFSVASLVSKGLAVLTGAQGDEPQDAATDNVAGVGVNTGAHASNAVTNITTNTTNPATAPNTNNQPQKPVQEGVTDTAQTDTTQDIVASDKTTSDEASAPAEQTVKNADTADNAVVSTATEAADQEAAQSNDDESVLASTQAMDLVTESAYALTIAAPDFGTETVKDPEITDNAHMNMGIQNIDKNHVIKVFFADEGQPPVTPDTIKDKDSVTITTHVSGGPGTITGGGVFVLDELGVEKPKVSWTVPENYDAKQLVIKPSGSDFAIPISLKEGETEAAIPDDVFKNPGNYEVTLVVERHVPGDTENPQQRTPSTPQGGNSGADNQGNVVTITTKLSGGPGSISATTEVIKGDAHTVVWDAGEIDGVKYRVAKVLIDGVEHPELVGATEYTFEDLAANHTIEVVLEPVPDDVDESGTNEPTDTNKGGTDKGDNNGGKKASSAKTGDMTAPIAGGIALIAVICGAVLLIARRRKEN